MEEVKITDRIKPINISDEMKTSFLDYAMSVIASRALPDARDGLKPVHRRILYAMNDLGIHADKAFKKSARIVGEVIGKYHPHGDTSVYEAMVRMAQDFSQRYLLVDGHGNFGSVDGDSAAAMRYTEARMSKIAMELVKEINKNTVDYKENYDGQEKEPVVLPARYPNLLVNGGTGIAVGMATNIPPHNLGEIIDGVIAVSQNPEITIDEISEIIKGPDFPTGGTILGLSGVKSYFHTGNGAVKVRAKYEVDTMDNGKERIIITEIPYQTNKARVVQKIAYLVREGKLKGISDLRDETSREGLRIVIEIKKTAVTEVVLNSLWKLTQLQSSFSVNMLSLVGLLPKVLNIKDVLSVYLDHQIEVIKRRTKFDLDKSLVRAHLLEGMQIALENITDIIEIIKAAKDTNSAQAELISKYNMSDKQAKAILDMKLSRLTGLERNKVSSELLELNKVITELKSILDSREKVVNIIETELLNIKDKFGDKRRTEIGIGLEGSIDDEDLIPVEDVVITVTNTGYCKRIPLNEYKTQNRGGVGSRSIKTKEEDTTEHTLITNTHSDLLFFTNHGKVYRIRAHQIPSMSKQSKGIPAINIINIEKGEKINSLIRVDEYKDKFIFFATKKGLVKKTRIEDFALIRKSGKIAIKLNIEDELVAVRRVTNEDDVLLGNSAGKAIRFPVSSVRPIGRSASGVRGMNIDEGDIVGFAVSTESKYILSVSSNGYGKLTLIDQYRVTNRGGKGIISIKCNDKIGNLVALRAVSGLEELLLITSKGLTSRFKMSDISITGRSAMGVIIMKVKDGQELAALAVIPSSDQLEAEFKGETLPERTMTEQEIEETQVLDMSEDEE